MTSVLEEDYKLFCNCIKTIGVKYDVSDDSFHFEGAKCSPEEIIRKVIAATRIYKPQHLIKDTATAAMDTFLIRARTAEKEKILARIWPFDPAIGDSEAKKVIALFCGCTAGEVNPLDVVALLSMLWQVKRKFAGHLRVAHPICPIFIGGQGFGKNWVLDELFKPVEMFRSGSVALKNVMNPFNLRLFNRFYIVPFDEMSTAKVKDFDHDLLKNLITEPTYFFRDPHGKTVFKLENIATCYGTSNNSMEDILPDDTDGRRWWEITVPDRQWSAEDSAKLKEIDMIRLWQSVDGASSENPRTVRLDAFRAAQKDKRKLSELGQFFAERLVPSPGEYVWEDEVLADLAVWRKLQNFPQRQITKKNFRAIARTHGFDWKNHHGRIRFPDVILARNED